jgi:hypothetical protein
LKSGASTLVFVRVAFARELPIVNDRQPDDDDGGDDDSKEYQQKSRDRLVSSTICQSNLEQSQ